MTEQIENYVKRGLVALRIAALAFLAAAAFASASFGETSKHTWPSLTDDQKATLTAKLKAIPGLKLDIVGGDL